MRRLELDLAALPKSKEEARLIGSKYYFDGIPCKYGHIDARRANNGFCTECHRILDRENKARWLSIPENAAANRKRSRDYYCTENGKAVVKTHASLRRAATRVRDLSPDNNEAVLQFIAACPPGYEVDHIIPLKGKPLSGYHSICNLQYLENLENRKKHTKVDPLTIDANVCVLPEYRSYIRLEDVSPELLARFPVGETFDKIPTWAQARITIQEDSHARSERHGSRRGVPDESRQVPA